MNRENPLPRLPPPAPPMKLALRAEEVAESLGVSTRSIMAMVAAGEIPYVRIGERCLRFPLAALEKWLAERTIRPPEVVSIGPEQEAAYGAILGANGHRAAVGAASGGAP